MGFSTFLIICRIHTRRFLSAVPPRRLGSMAATSPPKYLTKKIERTPRRGQRRCRIAGQKRKPAWNLHWMRPGCGCIGLVFLFLRAPGPLHDLDRFTDGSSTSWWNSENAVSIPLPSLSTFFSAPSCNLAVIAAATSCTSSCLIFAVSHVVVARRGEKIGGRFPSPRLVCFRGRTPTAENGFAEIQPCLFFTNGDERDGGHRRRKSRFGREYSDSLFFSFSIIVSFTSLVDSG